jgi:hypothetical protein
VRSTRPRPRAGSSPTRPTSSSRTPRRPSRSLPSPHRRVRTSTPGTYFTYPRWIPQLQDELGSCVFSFALAGALGCAVTHGALTPVDVVKTRIQLEPEVYNKVSRSPIPLIKSGR